MLNLFTLVLFDTFTFIYCLFVSTTVLPTHYIKHSALLKTYPFSIPTQVDVTNRSEKVHTDNYVYSGEWELLDVRIIRNEIRYPCCIEPYPDVTFFVFMRRRTLYYLFNIIFPCLWLTVLSLLGFWLPPDSGEKITLGITVLLAFSVFMLLIAESMPATSEFVPLIGK